MMEGVLVGAYVVFLIVVSATIRRQDKAEDYLLAGRRVTMPVFVASLVSTWYGGILGVGEYGYTHGLSNWLVFGVPYYFAALIFAFFIAARARRTGNFTIPDQLLRAYGPVPALLGSIVVFVMTAPAAYVLQLGILLHLAFGWPLAPALLAGTVFSLVYVIRGGLKGDLITDVAQFVLMFAGFAMVVAFASRHGGLSFLKEHLPAGYFTWHGGKPAGYLIAWYFIALGTLVEPAFYQRCYAARSERVAKWGIIVSVFFWMVFDLLTTTAGLYARALLPDLSDPVSAFPALGRCVLPPVAQGLFTVAMLAVVMSTVDSYLFLGGITLGRDIVWRLRGGDEGAVNRHTKAALVGTSALAVVLALWFRSVVDLWHHLGSVGTPALMLPLALSFSPRLRPGSRTAVAMIAAGGGVALAWLAWPSLPWGGGAYPFAVEPIFPGLGVSLLIYLCRRRGGRAPTPRAGVRIS